MEISVVRSASATPKKGDGNKVGSMHCGDHVPPSPSPHPIPGSVTAAHVAERSQRSTAARGYVMYGTTTHGSLGSVWPMTQLTVTCGCVHIPCTHSGDISLWNPPEGSPAPNSKGCFVTKCHPRVTQQLWGAESLGAATPLVLVNLDPGMAVRS